MITPSNENIVPSYTAVSLNSIAFWLNRNSKTNLYSAFFRWLCISLLSHYHSRVSALESYSTKCRPSTTEHEEGWISYLTYKKLDIFRNNSKIIFNRIISTHTNTSIRTLHLIRRFTVMNHIIIFNVKR